jgi:tetratricopeptide (TPR) repeat protein
MYYIDSALRMVALLVLAAASWQAITLARADAAFRKQTQEDVARSVSLDPRNIEYAIGDAIQSEYAGGDPEQLLRRAAELGPRSSAPRIRLGLAAEIRGDTVTAERWLLEAANVDRQFETRWALANFYFRQGRADDFWKWVRSALEISYGDRRLAFDLCSRMSNDDREILARAIPERREVVAGYLSYLIDKRQVMALAPAATKLIAYHGREDLPLLYAATDALIYGGKFQEASELWQQLGYPPPSGVSNSEFATPPIGHGFDWRIVDQPGVTHTALDSPSGHRIRLGGRQPESSELLRQVVGGLKAGATYALHWEARTQGFPSRTGLEWRIANASAAVSASENWSEGEVVFTTNSDHAVLALAYRRPEGEVRAEGILDLRGVRLSEIRQ